MTTTASPSALASPALRAGWPKLRDKKHGLDPDPRVVFGKVYLHLGRTVRAAIINKDDLQTRILVRHHLDEPMVGQRDDILFIEAGHDDG